MGNIIEIKNLSKSYKNGSGTTLEVLKDIDLTVEEGELTAIIGKSGSGKSTLLNILGCVDNFDSGEYLFCGTGVSKLSDAKRAALRGTEISFVFQDYALIEEENVIQNVLTPILFNKPADMEKPKEAAMQAMSLVGIADLAKKKVRTLSGGQKQRTAIARAIVAKPKLILADEPTGALDTETSKAVLELLVDLNKKGATVLIVTHDEELAKKCKRVVRLQDKKIFDV